MVSINGVVRGVMETWPLQLIIAEGTHQHVVGLTENTEVKQGGKSVTPAAILPGARVAVQAERRPPDGFVAHSIVVLG